MKYAPKQLFARLFAGKTKISNESLKKWNIALAVLFAAQAGAVLFFSVAHDAPLTVSYLTTDTLQTKLSGQTVTAPALHQLGAIDVSYLVAAVLIAAALTHAAMATLYRARYEASLKHGVSRLRWVEYVLSGGLMIVVVGLLSGISDAATLLMLFMLVGIMYFSGLGLELYAIAAKQRKSAQSWMAACVGIAAGVTPWLAVGLYLFATNIFGIGHISAYVYVLCAVVFIFFAKQVVNTHLTCMRTGKWATYAYGEGWHMALSFVGKTAFTWIVFAAVLHR